MKPSELRIGNWVYDPIHNEAEVELSTTMFCVFLSDWKYELQPIPITEQWLLEFGWVWNEDCNSYEKYPNGDARMHLEFHDINHSYTMFNYVLRSKIAEKIQYIHQLQNLYYALTGEELTRKTT